MHSFLVTTVYIVIKHVLLEIIISGLYFVKFLTNREEAWRVCLYHVCQMITFAGLDAESSYLHIRVFPGNTHQDRI